MFSLPWQTKRTSVAPKARPRIFQARPCLEILEAREAPAVVSGLSVTNESYSLFGQQETVTAQVSPSPGTSGAKNGITINTGTVTFTDGGQTSPAVPVSNGQASYTFKFNLFQEQPNAHPISSTYAGGTQTTNGTTYTIMSDPTGKSATAGATTTQFLFQIYFDYLLYQAFVGSQQG